MATERVNVCINTELLARLDEECARTGDNRSNFIRRAVIEYLNATQMMSLLPELIKESKAARLSNQMHLADIIEQNQKAPRNAKKA